MDSKDKFSLKLGDFSSLKFLKGSHRLQSVEQSSPKESFAELDSTNFDTASESNLDTTYDSLRWSSVPSSDESFSFALPSIQFIGPKGVPHPSGSNGPGKEEPPYNQLLQLSRQNQPDLTGQADSVPFDSSVQASSSEWQNRADQPDDATGGEDSSERLNSTDQLNATESERRLSTMEQSDSIDNQTTASRLVDLPSELKEHLAAKLTLYSILFGFDEIDDRIRTKLLEESSVLLDVLMSTRLVRASNSKASSAGLFEFDYAFKEKVVNKLVKDCQFLRNFEMLTSVDKLSLAIENHLLLALLNELPPIKKPGADEGH